MLSAALRNLFGRFSHHAFEEALEEKVFAEVDADPEADIEAVNPKIEPAGHIAWPPARLALVHQLWGAGFIFPGGEIETLRLARPLGATEATSLLIVGIGSGGPASAVARNMGTWVTGMESDRSLLTPPWNGSPKRPSPRKSTSKPGIRTTPPSSPKAITIAWHSTRCSLRDPNRSSTGWREH